MLSVLTLAGLLFAALSLLLTLRRVRLWRKGAATPVAWRGLLRVPRRYFVDVHHKVQRRAGAARMHVSAAGGLVGLMFVLIVTVLLQSDAQILRWALRVLAVLVLVGVGLDLMRRRPGRMPALSRGPWTGFPLWLGLVALGLLAASFLPVLPSQVQPSPASWPVAHQLVTLLLVVGLAGLFSLPGLSGPFKHAFAGLANLGFHPRPARFGDSAGAGASALATPAPDAPLFGTGTLAQMPWTRLLSFDACVECGRCQEVCPAFAAGQPLNPKALVQDLARANSGEAPGRGYAGAGHPGRDPVQGLPQTEAPVIGGLIAPETLWSCTTCRACVEACPMFIEHVDTIIDLRRFEAVETGDVPKGAQTVLQNLRDFDSPTGAQPPLRDWWANGLGVPKMSEVQATDVLLWCGDLIHDDRARATLTGLVTLLRAAKVDFAVLGAEETDTGDLARRLGDEVTFQRLARGNIETLRGYTFNRIVTPDPHVMHCLRNEYPALGGDYEVLHHSAYLLELVETGALRLNPGAARRVTYHDPCYLARYNSETEAPRQLLRALGADVLEMEHHGRNTRCCGGGGGAPVSDIPGERRVADMRFEDANQTGADTVVVGCPNCMSMLSGAAGGADRVADLVELLLDACEV